MREGIKRNESESTHLMISFLEYNDESCALTRKKNIEKKKKKERKREKEEIACCSLLVCMCVCVCVCFSLCSTVHISSKTEEKTNE